MDEEKIIVVGGYVGCGKTSWIYQQITSKEKACPKSLQKIIYLKAGTGQFQIDQKRINVDFLTVKVFGDGQEVEFLKELESADIAYIELGHNLGLGYIDQLLNDLPYYPVAIVPPGCKRCRSFMGKRGAYRCSNESFIRGSGNIAYRDYRKGYLWR